MAKARNGTHDAAALVNRVARLEAEVQLERHARRQAEQKLGGARSAIARLQAAVLRQKAEAVEAAAKQAEAEA
jgi:hypothetical protein